MLTLNDKIGMAKAAAKGAALLDEHRPSWRVAIRRAFRQNSVDMSYGRACILGHTFSTRMQNGYHRGLAQLGVDPIAHGFHIPRHLRKEPPSKNAAYSFLAECWLVLAHE